MSSADCCNLVGNYPNAPSGVFSINVNSKTEVSKAGSELIIGPTVGTVSMSGYAKNLIHRGCAGRASISIPWVRKYDCDNDELHFIFAGAGQSSVAGDIGGLASIQNSAGITYKVVSANSSSGPTTLYSKEEQEDGYGLSYNGGPMAFTTDDSGGAEFGNFLGVGSGPLYLQSFNLTTTPGQLPVANYSFIFKVSG